MRTLRFLSFLALGLWGSMAQGAERSVAAVVEKSATVAIDVFEMDNETWEAHYQFSEPVEGFRFKRSLGNKENLRKETWRFAEEGVGFSSDGSVISRRDGKPLRGATVVFPSLYESLGKADELTRKGSDGSHFLFTGYLDVEPVSPAGSQVVARKVRTLFRFHPLRGTRTVVKGVPHSPEQEWVADDQGAYVFWGSWPLRTEKGLAAMLDPGLEAGFRDSIWNASLAFRDFYTKAYDQPLSTSFFFAMELNPELTMDYCDYSGDVLQGEVNYRLSSRCRDWKTSDVNFPMLVAHELAHLWNAGVVTSDAREFPHGHEAQATAAALLASRALGTLDATAFTAQAQRHVDRCLGAMTHRDLRKNYRGAYDCGAVVGLAMDGWLRKHHKGDFFSLWKDVFRAAREQGGKYSFNLFLRTLAGRTGDAKLFADVRTLFLEEAGDGGRIVERLLTLGGVPFVTEARSEAVAGEVAFATVFHLMSGNCGGTDFSWEKLLFTTGAWEGCPGFQAPLSIVGLGARRFADDPEAIARDVGAACGSQGSVRFLLKDGSQSGEIPCKKPAEIHVQPVRFRLLPAK